MIYSEFKRFVPWIFLCSFFSLALLSVVVILYYHSSGEEWILISLIAVVAFFILFYLELKKRAVCVSIGIETISVKTFLGFGSERTIHFSEIAGYKLTILASEYRDYESLKIISSKGHTIRLSEFYHKNYPTLKKEISERFRNLNKK